MQLYNSTTTQAVTFPKHCGLEGHSEWKHVVKLCHVLNQTKFETSRFTVIPTQAKVIVIFLARSAHAQTVHIRHTYSHLPCMINHNKRSGYFGTSYGKQLNRFKLSCNPASFRGGQSHSNWSENVGLGCVDCHTKFETIRFTSFQTQANVNGAFY